MLVGGGFQGAILKGLGSMKTYPVFANLIDKPCLVVGGGAVGERKVQDLRVAAAQARAIWVNVADAPELCTFIVPAQVRRGDLTVAISTGGASPALARKLREELQQRFGPEYAPYLALLQGIRERLLADARGPPENSRLFHRLVDSPLREAVARGDRARILNLLKEILGTALSPQVVGELVVQALAEPRE